MKNPKKRKLAKPKYISKLRHCEVCGAILSGYNKKNRCFVHQSADEVKTIVR